VGVWTPEQRNRIKYDELAIEEEVQAEKERKESLSIYGCLRYFDIPTPFSTEYKDKMHEVLKDKTIFNEEQQQQILDYCQSDVDALKVILPLVTKELSTPELWTQALYRGYYNVYDAKIHVQGGLPVNPMLKGVLNSWDKMKSEVIQAEDTHHLYEQNRDGSYSFKDDRFSDWIISAGLSDIWPLTKMGKFSKKDEFFQKMETASKEVTPIHQLRQIVKCLGERKLQITEDNWNRCTMWPFTSKTSRSQPKGSEFIFLYPTFARCFIKPHEGMALIARDYSQQEYIINAVLSGETKMIEAYETGDPYLAGAIQAGDAPVGATKTTHPDERNNWKNLTLGILYGMTERGLVVKLDKDFITCSVLLDKHRQTYPRFWAWKKEVLSRISTMDYVQTTFGWRYHPWVECNKRTLGNFFGQATGAEIMRLAVHFAFQRGLNIACTLHDALYCNTTIERAEEDNKILGECMAEASRHILGYTIKSDYTITRYPNFYMNRGTEEGAKKYDRSKEKVGYETYLRIVKLYERLNNVNNTSLRETDNTK
jgi:hypothetical protein